MDLHTFEPQLGVECVCLFGVRLMRKVELRSHVVLLYACVGRSSCIVPINTKVGSYVGGSVGEKIYSRLVVSRDKMNVSCQYTEDNGD